MQADDALDWLAQARAALLELLPHVPDTEARRRSRALLRTSASALVAGGRDLDAWVDHATDELRGLRWHAPSDLRDRIGELVRPRGVFLAAGRVR